MKKPLLLGWCYLVIAIALCVIVIFRIDNTIRLAMFSNRFLIKTMPNGRRHQGIYCKTHEHQSHYPMG